MVLAGVIAGQLYFSGVLISSPFSVIDNVAQSVLVVNGLKAVTTLRWRFEVHLGSLVHAQVCFGDFDKRAF